MRLQLRPSRAARDARPVSVTVFRKIYLIDWRPHGPPRGATASPLTQTFARFIRSVSKNITNRKLSTTCARDRALGQLLCPPLTAHVRTPRSRSRSEVLVRSMRSRLPTAGSSSAGLSARHKHAGRAATGRRRELGLVRGQVEERAADLATRVTGWGHARVGMAIRRPRFF